MPGYLLPWCTAASQGMFEAEGLEVELKELALGGPGTVRAVAAGEVDFAEVSVKHFFTTIQSDGPLPARFAFMIERRTHMAAITISGRPTAAGRFVRSLADLAGASIVGSKESPLTRELLVALERLGVEPGPLVETPYQEVMEALAAGAGDVAADWIDLLPNFGQKANPFGVQATAIGLASAGLAAQYVGGFLMNESVLASSPQTVAAMVRALRQGMLAARRDPAPGLAALAARYPEVDPDLALAQWETGKDVIFGDGDDVIGVMDPRIWSNTVEFHLDAHGGPPLELDSLYYPGDELTSAGAPSADC
ncbi:MAG: ABC transporter substrate-binding protein [Acidimicrobiales bacterium]